MLIALPHHHQGAMAKTTLTQPAQTDQPDVVIGVDTHKDFHEAVALATNGGRLASAAFPRIAWVTPFSKTGLLRWGADLFLPWKAPGPLVLACAVSSWPSGTPLLRSTGRIVPPAAGWARTMPSTRRPQHAHSLLALPRSRPREELTWLR